VLADGSVVTLGGEAPGRRTSISLAVIGSEGTLALVTEICVRLLPKPERCRRCCSTSPRRDACRTVSAAIADGIVPAAMEIMDQHTVAPVERGCISACPLDRGAVLLIEVDGPAVSLDAQVERITRSRKRTARVDARRARRAERAAIWKGRKSAFGAYGRSASGFYIMDGVVPRTRLAEALATVYRLCEERGLHAGNVFHAGDGNLHPHVLFDADDPAAQARALEASHEILRMCIRDGRHDLRRARCRHREAAMMRELFATGRPRGDGARARGVRSRPPAQPRQDPAGREGRRPARASVPAQMGGRNPRLTSPRGCHGSEHAELGLDAARVGRPCTHAIAGAHRDSRCARLRRRGSGGGACVRGGDARARAVGRRRVARASGRAGALRRGARSPGSIASSSTTRRTSR
jgi:hypothetical protein